MNKSFKITQNPENSNWKLSKTLDDQELDICFKVYSWQEFILKQNQQSATMQFFPYFSSTETSKLVNPDVKELSQNNFLAYVESEFIRLERQPAICLNLNHPEYSLQVRFLSEKGYSPLPEKDTFMIYRGNSKNRDLKSEAQISITDCNSAAQKDVFIDVFNEAFFDGRTNVTEAYELIVRKSFEPNPDYKVENFIYPSVEFPDKMVACSSLLTDINGASKIYNVGTLPEFRRQGLAFKMLEKVIEHWLSFDQKDYLSIHTVADSSPERLYTKLGFERVCLQETWVKG
ncbi:MAG: GNAT family N-acetyltransferase [bacterium]